MFRIVAKPRSLGSRAGPGLRCDGMRLAATKRRPAAAKPALLRGAFSRMLAPMLRLPLPALWLLLAVACSSPPASPPAPARVALVLGNAAYQNATPLVNPAHDAEDMCAALKKLGFRTLCHQNLRDRAEFDARVREYAALLGPETVGVVYYSGHGVQAGNANFLIPTQTQVRANENPLAALYGVDELFERIGRQRTRFQLVILDACRDDLFAPAPRAGAGRGVATPLVKSLEVVARAGNGLQPIKDAPAGTLVLYATASKDTAFDGEGRNGPLTKHILAHIGTRGIVVEDFFKRVISGVEQETAQAYRKRQSPFIYGSFSGRFCFAGCPGERDAPQPPAF